MRELPAYLSFLDAPLSSGHPTSAAPAAAPAPSSPRTLVLYGYQIGEEADPLLYGHPDLKY